jgi:hypothetical protein
VIPPDLALVKLSVVATTDLHDLSSARFAVLAIDWDLVSRGEVVLLLARGLHNEVELGQFIFLAVS